MTNQNHYQTATNFLARLDKDWANLIRLVGPCTLTVETERSPYQALVRAIAFQQLHANAANAILGRLMALCNQELPEPEKLLALDYDQMRACGFSARKIETLYGIANAALDGTIPSRKIAATLSDQDLVKQLVTLKGVGRWTVEMLMIFTLGRMDILPIDDFGICDGFRRLKGLAAKPSPKEMAALGVAWQPHRTIASWYLWRVPK